MICPGWGPMVFSGEALIGPHQHSRSEKSIRAQGQGLPSANETACFRHEPHFRIGWSKGGLVDTHTRTQSAFLYIADSEKLCQNNCSNKRYEKSAPPNNAESILSMAG